MQSMVEGAVSTVRPLRLAALATSPTRGGGTRPSGNT
jgi:hypothetical protein